MISKLFSTFYPWERPLNSKSQKWIKKGQTNKSKVFLRFSQANKNLKDILLGTRVYGEKKAYSILIEQSIPNRETIEKYKSNCESLDSHIIKCLFYIKQNLLKLKQFCFENFLIIYSQNKILIFLFLFFKRGSGCVFQKLKNFSWRNFGELCLGSKNLPF